MQTADKRVGCLLRHLVTSSDAPVVREGDTIKVKVCLPPSCGPPSSLTSFKIRSPTPSVLPSFRLSYIPIFRRTILPSSLTSSKFPLPSPLSCLPSVSPTFLSSVAHRPSFLPSFLYDPPSHPLCLAFLPFVLHSYHPSHTVLPSFLPPVCPL
jgi:hypothetical protein